MIAFARPATGEYNTSAWQARFLSMVPTIRRCLRFAFRKLKEEAKEDAIVEALANAMVAYVSLCERGKEPLAYPTVLARYAIAQYRAGRRIGSRMNRHDVFANQAKRPLQRLPDLQDEHDDWFGAVIEDTKTAVPDQAAFRCDFPAWLATHDARNRGIAQALAIGDSTREVAKRFGVSPGRISQLRIELHDSWHRFHGEELRSSETPRVLEGCDPKLRTRRSQRQVERRSPCQPPRAARQRHPLANSSG